MPIEIAAVADVERESPTLVDILKAHAAGSGNAFDNRPFLFRATEDGRLAGGVLGRVLFDWGYVSYLGVTEGHRGRGLGTRLLATAERHCAAEGARGVVLDTFVFQAPAFYPRMGYVEIGRLPSGHPGRDRVYLRKLFDETPAGEPAR